MRIGYNSKQWGVEMKEKIEINPNVHFGKPCIAGTRIPVQSVLELISEGLTFETITRDYYPDIQADDIKACIQFAIDVLNAVDIHISEKAA